MFLFSVFYATLISWGLCSQEGIERVTGRKARGPQAAGGNRLQMADVYFLLYTKLKEASFNSVLKTPSSALS